MVPSHCFPHLPILARPNGKTRTAQRSMARLDDPQLQADLLTAVGRCGKIEDAAKAIGLSRRSVSAYMKTHQELKLKVDAARRQMAVLTNPLPPSLGSGATLGELLTEEGKRELLGWLRMHAADPGSRAASKALDILSQLHFAPEILAMKAAAQLEASAVEAASSTSSKPLVLRLPAKTRTPQILDAEIVDQSTEVG